LLSFGIDGLIVAERWYHAVDALRRCRPADELPSGWWDDVQIPAPQREVVTGVISSGPTTIVVRNGSPALDNLVLWGLSRFEAAGLDAPPIRGVGFERNTAECEGIDGRSTLRRDGGSEILLCRDQLDVCHDPRCDRFTLDGRQVMLHELAHVWMNAYLDDATQAAYLAHIDLDQWGGSDVEYAERGEEHAAETMAWGLLDAPFAVWRAQRFPASPEPAELAAGYQILTSTAPLLEETKLTQEPRPAAAVRGPRGTS
jgi:hypothetical protein